MNIELWKVMSSEPEKCITTLKKGTGSGINSGYIKGDFLATKDGWMGYTLQKRLENNIITVSEYETAMNDYNNISSNIDKIKNSKKKRYLSSDRLAIPVINISNKNLSEFDKKVEQAICELSKKYTGLFTYTTISDYLKLNKINGALICSNSVKRLWDHYYDRSNVYKNF